MESYALFTKIFVEGIELFMDILKELVDGFLPEVVIVSA
jgi:hypothetical protein